MPKRKILSNCFKLWTGPDSRNLKDTVFRKKKADQASFFYGVSLDNSLNGKRIVGIEPKGKFLFPGPVFIKKCFNISNGINIFVK